MSDYHREFEESLQEGSMLLQINHPLSPHGMASEGDLPQCGMIDGLVGHLTGSVPMLLLHYISMGHPVEVASHLAMESVIRSALEVGFATGRVFQSHGFNVPASV
jgi:hypothetical protein